MQTLPIAVREHESEEEISPNDTNKQLGHDVPDPLSTVWGGPGNRNRVEPREPGTVAGQSWGRPELGTEGNHISNDAHGAVQSEVSGSQCRFPGRTVDRIDFF